MDEGIQNTSRSTLQDKLTLFTDKINNKSRAASRFLTPKNLLVGASMLGVGLVAACTDSSTSPNIDEKIDEKTNRGSGWVYYAEKNLYRQVGEKEVLGCDDTSFEAYSRTGKPFDSVDYLTKDGCGPINPAGSTSVGEDVDDLVGFSALIRINDTNPDVAQIQYVSCYPRGGRLTLTNGKPDFTSIECFVDKEKAEWTRNAVGIRGTIYGVGFDAGADNNWELDSKEMVFTDKKTVPIFENIKNEKFVCKPKYLPG